MGDIPGAGGSAQDRRVRVHRLAGDTAHHMDTEFQAQGVDAPSEVLEAAATRAADGKRFAAGTSRETSSISRGTKGLYADEDAPGSYHWMSTTMYSHPKGASRAAMYSAFSRTSSSRTLAPYTSQLFHPRGGWASKGPFGTFGTVSLYHPLKLR